MNKLSVLTELSDATVKLSPKEKRIYDLIVEYWPITALEIAEQLEEDISNRELKKKASTKYTYYLHKLVDKKVVLSKRAGNAMIVWPLHVEKYRAIHEILGR